VSVGREGDGDGGQGGRGVVDDLEDAVAADEVEAARGSDLGEAVGIALPRRDVVGDAGLGGAPRARRAGGRAGAPRRSSAARASGLGSTTVMS